MPDLATDLLLVLLKDGYNHNFVLVCEGGERVEVHQVILAARSAVLKRMTEVNMKERNTGTIVIKDFEPGVVKEFITYLYSDKISPDFSDLAELMRIGHQYEVSSLVDLCSSRLVQEVSLDNVADLGTLAETLEAMELSEKCSEVVAENFEHFDTKTLDSLPSSFLRKSYALSRRKMLSDAAKAAEDAAKATAAAAATLADAAKATAAAVESALAETLSSSEQAVDQNTHFMANFFTNHGNPVSLKVGSSITTQFCVNREVKLAGIGLYISKGSFSIDLTLTSVNPHNAPVLVMSTTVISTDSSKPLKIIFPAPVKITNNGYHHQVQIKFGTECVNFSGDNAKFPLSLAMKNRELKVSRYSISMIQIPVLYFED